MPGREIANFVQSVRGILDQVPLDGTPASDQLVIDPRGCCGLPDNIKSHFKLVFLYKDAPLSFTAAYFVRPVSKELNNFNILIVITINKKYEDYFRGFHAVAAIDQGLVQKVCWRRSVYIHELCHALAAIRLFHDDYGTITAKCEYLFSLEKKFGRNLGEHIESRVPAFDYPVDHYRFKGDNLDYKELYQEIMISGDQIKTVVKEMYDSGNMAALKGCSLEQRVAVIKHIDPEFFKFYPIKKAEFLWEIANHGFCTAP